MTVDVRTSTGMHVYAVQQHTPAAASPASIAVMHHLRWCSTSCQQDMPVVLLLFNHAMVEPQLAQHDGIDVV